MVPVWKPNTKMEMNVVLFFVLGTERGVNFAAVAVEICGI